MAKKSITVNILGKLDPSLGKAFGDADSKVGQFAKVGVAAFAAVGAAAVGIGVGLFKLGESFDEASDKIRVGTGATGEALTALEGSFDNVLKTVPTSFGDASTAIADLNTRLGLTGPELEAASAQFINLSRITGTDLASNIELTSRTFGDWGIAVADQGPALDYLYRVSQTTGIGLDQLNSQITAYGAPLRQFGFSFEESAALLGKFEKEGVNAELVVGSLRQGLGKLARSGEDPIDTLGRITDQIKNAGSTSEANGLALELFGARAGPDMAAAIREGRFELDDLLGSLAEGDTINQAAADTESFGEKWQLFKNRILVGLKPLAVAVFDAVGKAMDKLGPIIEPFIAIMAARLPGVMVQLRQVFRDVWAVVQPILVQFAEVARGVVDSIIEAWPQISAFFENMKSIVMSAITIITVAWEQFGDDILRLIQIAWATIVPVISGAMKVISGIFEAFAALFTGDWAGLWAAIKKILSGALDIVKALISGAFEVVKTLVGAALETVVSIITSNFDSVIGFVSRLPGRITSAASGMWDGIKDAFRSAINWIIDKWNGLEFTIGGGSFAGVDFPSMTLGTPNIPKLHTGGVVPGYPGQERLYLLEAGETVRTREQEASLGGFHIENLYVTERNMLDEFVELEARYGVLV